MTSIEASPLNELKQLVHSLNGLDVTAEKLESAAALLVRLRRVHRTNSLRGIAHREEVVHLRQKLDQRRLIVHNLGYEKMHLKRDIHISQDIDPIYTSLPLIPLPEFHARMAQIQQPSVESLNEGNQDADEEHKLQLRRLEFELAERERLKANVAKLRVQKNKWAAKVNKKRKELEDLDRKTQSYFKMSESLWKDFGITAKDIQVLSNSLEMFSNTDSTPMDLS